MGRPIAPRVEGDGNDREGMEGGRKGRPYEGPGAMPIFELMRRSSVLTVLVVLLASSAAMAQAPASTQDPPPPPGTSPRSALLQAAEAAARQRSTRERISSLTREADALGRQSQSILTELRVLDVERDLQRAREQQAQQALVVLDADLQALAARQQHLQATLAVERPAVTARLVRLQRMGRVGYARIAWNASSARSVGRAARLMTRIARDDAQRLQAYRRTAAALADTESRIALRRTDAAALRTEARARRMGAELAYQRKQDLLATLDMERGQRERWLAEMQDARVRLDAEVSGRTPSATLLAALPLTSRRRQLPWPVQGAIAQRFGRQRDARFGTATVRNGIDIASPSGGPARAIHPGTVVFADPFTGFGQLVIVDHGGQAYSLYGYLSAVRVTRGTRVESGTVVGDVGESPVGGAALYLELRIDGRPVDPLQWLRRPN